MKKQILDWDKVTQEFCRGAEKELEKLARKGRESSITFWIHTDYMPVVIYTDTKSDGDGAARFNIPTLAKEYNRKQRTLGYDELEKQIFNYFGKACLALKKKKVFDALAGDTLSIWVATVDSERKLMCTVGNMQEVNFLFKQSDLKFDLSMIGSGKAKEKWWYARDSMTGDEVKCKPKLEELFEKSGLRSWTGTSVSNFKIPVLKATLGSTRRLYDWMTSNEHEVWSYKLCSLMKAIGVANIEYYPIEVTHQSLQQTSQSYYSLAIVVGTSTDVVCVDEYDNTLEDINPIAPDVEFLAAKKPELNRSELKVFRISTSLIHGLVVDNEVKLACEANSISGIEFSEIPFWKNNGLKELSKRSEKGDMRALLRLGRIHLEGIGLPANEQNAMGYFEIIMMSKDNAACDEMRHYLIPGQPDIFQKLMLGMLQKAWDDVKSRDLKSAEQKCNAILSFQPRYGQACFLQARLLWLTDGIERYLKRKDEFIEKVKHDTIATSQLSNLAGCALDDLKRYAEALTYFEKAELYCPDEGMYQANIAECHYKLHHAKKAVSYAKKAVAKNYKSDILNEIIINDGIMPEGGDKIV